MWVARNENGNLRCFLNCPSRWSDVPKEHQFDTTFLMANYGTRYSVIENRLRYSKTDNQLGYWDISNAILDGRGFFSEAEEKKLIELIGFNPTWEMKPFELYMKDRELSGPISYGIGYKIFPVISNYSINDKHYPYKGDIEVISREEFVEFLKEK